MYDIIQGDDAADLISKVNERMKDDWRPLGAPMIVQYYGQYYFVQAMVKEDHSWYGREPKITLET